MTFDFDDLYDFLKNEEEAVEYILNMPKDQTLSYPDIFLKKFPYAYEVARDQLVEMSRLHTKKTNQ